jgi:NAD(P)-dependent dehydrogenase (short-subunit alcohol dehydrogenase family)
MARLLEGKVSIVTGAGRGLGRAHALALAEAGASVLVNDLGGGHRGEGSDPSTAESVVSEIRAKGGRAAADTSNVADWDACGAMVEKAVSNFGGLDIVVNNAGICRFADMGEMTREDWELTIAVNLTGTAAVANWAARYWREIGPRPGRAIVNTSSPAGTNPAPGSPSYCASKAGVAALTIAAATALAPLGVRVNAIAPMARTRMTLAVPALDEIMKPVEIGFDRLAAENVSPLVVYLASEPCRFTGRVFGIEGDDLFLFDGWSAEHHFNNCQKRWSPETLERALAKADRQDRGYMIAPSTRTAAPSPSDETLAALDRLRAV